MGQDPAEKRPSASMIVVGNEILLGRTRDTNTLMAIEMLRKRGVGISRWVVVRDDKNEIKGEVRHVLGSGCELVIVSGGMGPTHDDVTVEAVAAAFDLDMRFCPDCFSRMRRKWSVRNPGRDMPGTSERGLKKMATIPEGFLPMENKAGMAEGLYMRFDGGRRAVAILPGVPAEYRSVLENPIFLECLPPGTGGGISVFEVRYHGRESEIAEELERLQRRHPRVEIGSYPRGRLDVLIRMTGDEKEVRKARSELESMVKSVKRVHSGD